MVTTTAQFLANKSAQKMATTVHNIIGLKL